MDSMGWNYFRTCVMIARVMHDYDCEGWQYWVRQASKAQAHLEVDEVTVILSTEEILKTTLKRAG